MVTPSPAQPNTPVIAANGPSADALQSLAALAIDTAVRLGVSTWVISPGSRSAPLTAALATRSDVTRYVIVDERSAGYIALGLAQQLHAPVGLVCTSGTATLNYGPAIAEALHQSIPLLVLTADRPAEWIDQQDNQALRQNGLYGQNVRASFALPLDDSHPDTRWHAVRTVADALQVATAQPNGPVHINVPLREPLYAPSMSIVRPVKVAIASPTITTLADSTWDSLIDAWLAARRILILGGPNPPDVRLQSALRTLLASDSVAAIGDVTANIGGFATSPGWDAALGTRDASTLDELAPDLVINFGGAVTSKGLKALLRSRPPQEFWRIGQGLPAPDTYQAMTHAIPMTAADFLSELAARTQRLERPATGYAANWRALGDMATTAVDSLLDGAPFGEYAATRALLHSAPTQTLLQIGNSMPIRYANLLGELVTRNSGGVFANRGVSGIDGCVSTAVGAALARPDALTLLIVGDLAFFYDRNSLWHRHLPPNLRIALLNNHGGGIFDIIDGPDTLPDATRRDYFLTPQPLTAQRTAADHGLEYTHVADADALQTALPAFFAGGGAKLLEIDTDMATNSAIFRDHRARMAALSLGHPRPTPEHGGDS